MSSPDFTRVSVEQRCLAAQALWVAANRMLTDDDPRAREWLNTIGYDEMHYRCRCKKTIEAFYDGRKLAPRDCWASPEDYARTFLTCCISKKSMNLNREWRVYLTKEIYHKVMVDPTEKKE